MEHSQQQISNPSSVIRYAFRECFLGKALVAQSARGVCAVLLGDEPELLQRDLQARFPKAELIADEAELQPQLDAVAEFVAAPQRGWQLPLDIRGTPFQQRVWQALRDIPAGETASYTQIAKRIGQPSAVRAVARACCANPVAVVIPCHRVVRVDGGLAGYRWGLARKRALLELEAQARLAEQPA